MKQTTQLGTAPDHAPPNTLLVLDFLVGGVALVCGIALMRGGLNMPISVLEESPFETFLIPGLILSLAVGVSLLLAGLLAVDHNRIAPLASIAAGTILMGWIAVESVLVDDGRLLQLLVFVIAAAILWMSVQWRRQESARQR